MTTFYIAPVGFWLIVWAAASGVFMFGFFVAGALRVKG